MNCPLCYGLCPAQALPAMPSQLQWDMGMGLGVVAMPSGPRAAGNVMQP